MVGSYGFLRLAQCLNIRFAGSLCMTHFLQVIHLGGLSTRVLHVDRAFSAGGLVLF